MRTVNVHTVLLVCRSFLIPEILYLLSWYYVFLRFEHFCLLWNEISKKKKKKPATFTRTISWRFTLKKDFFFFWFFGRLMRRLYNPWCALEAFEDFTAIIVAMKCTTGGIFLYLIWYLWLCIHQPGWNRQNTRVTSFIFTLNLDLLKLWDHSRFQDLGRLRCKGVHR